MSAGITQTGAGAPEAAPAGGFGDLLLTNGVLVDVRATSKKHLFHEIARVAGEATGLETRSITDALVEREKLGSTGVGAGVAIPHAPVEGIDRMWGLFARLAQPIDFDSVDERPVDLVFMLLAPEEPNSERLRALARVSRAMRRPVFRERLRAAAGIDAVRALLVGDGAETDAA